MPLTNLQTDILKLIAAHRSDESYVAGGSVLNKEGLRFSNDLDIFNDTDQSLDAIAQSDAAALAASGLTVRWLEPRTTSKISAEISRGSETTRLDWVGDSNFRFFPVVRDAVFGYVLHPVDLAINKAAAAADRREPRDIVDLVAAHEKILPLGAIICAALGRFPGPTPEWMLAEIRQHARLTAPELEALATDGPIDAAALHRRIQNMLADADRFLQALPSTAVGYVFLENGAPVQPDPAQLDRYTRHSATKRGHWPASASIDSAMIERQTSD